MKKNLFYIVLFLTALKISFAQNIRYPIPVLPHNNLKIKTLDGQRILFLDTNKYSIANDTLWILKHKQIKKTIKVAKENEVYKKQIATYRELTDTLKAQINVQKSLIDTLKSDRDFYVKVYNEAEKDLIECQKNTKRQATYFRMALIGGIVLSVATFFLGAYLFH